MTGTGTNAGERESADGTPIHGGDLVDRVVRVVDYQTDAPRLDRAPEHVVLTVLSSHADYPSDDVRDALATAVGEGRLKSEDGRYWRPATND